MFLARVVALVFVVLYRKPPRSRCGTLHGMPWVPEVFSAPVQERLKRERRRETLLTVPYFEGVMAGETNALIESFAGKPELHHPVREIGRASCRERV